MLFLDAAFLGVDSVISSTTTEQDVGACHDALTSSRLWRCQVERAAEDIAQDLSDLQCLDLQSKYGETAWAVNTADLYRKAF